MATTCGTDGHDPSCNCDVKFAAPCPIRFGLDELGGFDTVNADNRFGVPWRSRDLPELLTRFDRRRAFLQEIRETSAPIRYGKMIKMALANGLSILALPDLLEVDMPTVCRNLSLGKRTPYWDWQDDQWERWERLVRSSLTHGQLAKQFGLTQQAARRLREKYGAV